MTRTAATSLILLAAACGKESQDAPAGPRQTAEVEGAVTLDGTPRVVTRCEVKPSLGSIALKLHLAGGAVVTYDEEHRQVYVNLEDDFLKGDRYTCTSGGARDIMWGTGTGGNFFHGGLAFTCERGASKVTADLTLRCGVLDDETRQRLEGEIEKARDLVE